MQKTITTQGHAPGPRVYEIPGLINRFRRRPLDVSQTLGREYGDCVRIGARPFEAFILYHPSDVRHVLLDNHHNYSSQSVLASVAGENLVTAEGDSWLYRRRLMQPAFHHAALTTMSELMAADIQAMVQRWMAVGATSFQLELKPEIHRLTLQVIGHSLFGMELSPEGQVGTALSTLDDYLADRLMSLAPLPPGWPTRRNRQMHQAIAQIREAITAIIHARREEQSTSHDLLDMLMQARDEQGIGLSDEELYREVGLLINAGYETTTSAMTWAFYLLARNPACEAKLQAEVQTVLKGQPPTAADLPSLTYTRRVIEETLRLYPPAWALGRRALAPDTLRGIRLPANAAIFIPSFAIQRDERFWSEPDCFNPERFEAQHRPTTANFAYLPFGGGPRLCIGNTFALMEMQLILASVVQRFRLQLLPGYQAEIQPLLTLQVKGNLPMQITVRTPSLRPG